MENVENTPAPDTNPRPLLSVAVPVYNERATLLPLLEKVLAVPLHTEILLVDDGSTDGTRDLLCDLRGQYPNVRVLFHEQNRGKGAAIRTAIQHATGEFLVVQDADLEYDPAEFVPMLEPLLAGWADVVYGSRFKGSIYDMRRPNLVANRVLSHAVNILYPGARITDEATCYKMFRRTVLNTLPLCAERFDFCPEVTAKLLKRGVRIWEVPITYHARTNAQGKKIRWTDGFDALWTLIKYRVMD